MAPGAIGHPFDAHRIDSQYDLPLRRIDHGQSKASAELIEDGRALRAIGLDQHGRRCILVRAIGASVPNRASFHDDRDVIDHFSPPGPARGRRIVGDRGVERFAPALELPRVCQNLLRRSVFPDGAQKSEQPHMQPLVERRRSWGRGPGAQFRPENP